MVGIIAGEGWTRLEVYPVVLSKFGFSIPLPNFTTDDQLKEWGIAISPRWDCLWLWKGDEQSFLFNQRG